MLQKNYSRAVIGRSYLSFLYGIELLREKNSVLVLDDERLEYGDLFSYALTDLDIAFFETWGEDRSIQCLTSIRDYVAPKPYTLVIGGRYLRLGSDCWSNLRELYRKFPEFFPFENFFTDEGLKDQFMSDYQEMTRRLGVNGFRFKGLENSTIDFLLGQSPELFKDAYHLFNNAIKKNKKESWPFLYFSRSLFHKRLSSSFSNVELFHFFLCLLSPHYILDESKLSEELSQVFMEKGGHFKETQVREWKFYKSLPWSMELASYEGIIHPHKISFLGSSPQGLPLKINHSWRRFRSFHFEVQCQDHRLSKLKDEWFFWSELKNMATDIPMWRFEVGEEKITGQILYREKSGSKLKFFHQYLNKKISAGLEEWMPDITQKCGNIHFSSGKEVYLDQSSIFKTQALPRLKEVKLYDYSSPFLRSRLKNVSYFGPLKGCPLGLFGQLLELRDHSKQA